MSTLWTPGGEHRVAADQDAGGGGRGGGRPLGPRGAGPGAPEDPDTLDRAQAEVLREEMAAELADIERQLLAAPVEDVVANHCYGLFQLAALHLGQRPPNLDAARLAIDAFGGVVEALGDRFGEHAQSLRDGLAQLRLAFVQIASEPPIGDAAAGDAAAGTGGD
ncbi:MAG TPA: hypothetical protein VMU75_14090 [Acidimicrobiales bacterium]|nr:hypothetical protein [Acidimicrobiales bacterium]